MEFLLVFQAVGIFVFLFFSSLGRCRPLSRGTLSACQGGLSVGLISLKGEEKSWLEACFGALG
jgi:hypothetical protein